MKYVDIKAVLRLARNIASDAKTLTSNAKELRAKLSALEGTFHDDGFAEVNEYSKLLISQIVDSNGALETVVLQLMEYAELLMRGKGTASIESFAGTDTVNFQESGDTSAINNNHVRDGNWKTITYPHSYIDDARATNPNFDENSIEWSFNCQRCVAAYELRRRGYDVTARPCPTTVRHRIFSPDQVIPDHQDCLMHDPFSVWIPPDAVHCPDQLSVENQMAAWGDGARAEVMVLWAGQNGRGHVFVAEQINGYTHFIDPQTGEEAVAYYFDQCDKNSIYICRTDNKELSSLITGCCM